MICQCDIDALVQSTVQHAFRIIDDLRGGLNVLQRQIRQQLFKLIRAVLAV